MSAERLLEHYERIADAPDAISSLRRFVINLAVRGKLVAQDPQDEPASDLMKRLADARKRLVNEGVERDRSGSTKIDEVPFRVPTSWCWVRFCDLAGFSAGRTPSRSDTSYWNTGEYAWVSIADMEDGQVLTATKETVSESARKKVFASEPEQPGTIVMSFKLTIGKIARLGIAAFHNEAIISIRPYLHNLDAYLFKALPQFARQGNTKGAIKGATLNRESISDILVPLPPLAEQHRIVAKVDELMALCDRLEEARAARETKRDRLAAASLAGLHAPDPETFQNDARFALDHLAALATRPDQIKQLRQTILNLAVRGKLVPHDPKDPPAQVSSADVGVGGRLSFDVPSNWRWVRLEDVASARLGKMLDKAKNSGRPYPYLRNTNVHWFEVRCDDLKMIRMEPGEFEEYRLDQGDVLICEGGHGIGRTAVWTGVRNDLVFQKALHRVRPGLHLEPNFFAQCAFVYFHAGVMQAHFTGVGIPHFTGRALAKLVFPLPPISEQRRIVAKVDELLALCKQLEAGLITATATRHRLLDVLLAETLTPSVAIGREAAE